MEVIFTSVFCVVPIAIAVIVAFFSSFFIVRQQQVAVLESLGKFSRTAGAGFHFKIPFIERVVGNVSLRIEQLDTVVETKTKDNVFTGLTISVQYYVDESMVYDSFYKLGDPARQISSFVFDSVRAQVPNILLDEVFEKKDDIALQLKKDLDEVMSSFGFTIYRALVTDIEPDQKVKAAMNEINAQQRLKMAALEKAEATKIEVVKAAEADAESKKLQGVGVAEQRRAIIEGYRKSVEQFQADIKGVNANDVMMLVLMTQYFDTMKEVADKSKTNTIFVPNNAAATGDILEQMRSAFIQANEVNKSGS